MASRACGEHLAAVAATLGYRVVAEPGSRRGYRVHLNSAGTLGARREFATLMRVAYNLVPVDFYGEIILEAWRRPLDEVVLQVRLHQVRLQQFRQP
jgi:hypothetical protein